MTDERQEQEARERRADEGRAAMASMLTGFQDVTASLGTLARLVDGVGRELVSTRKQNVELAGLLQASVETQRIAIEHSAALQRQIGVLVLALAQRTDLPAVPVGPVPQITPPLDPIGRAANFLVNGAMDRLNGNGRSRKNQSW